MNYSNPGIFDVTLIATNNAGSSTPILSEGIEVRGPANRRFWQINDNFTIILINLSTGAEVSSGILATAMSFFPDPRIPTAAPANMKSALRLRTAAEAM